MELRWYTTKDIVFVDLHSKQCFVKTDIGFVCTFCFKKRHHIYIIMIYLFSHNSLYNNEAPPSITTYNHLSQILPTYNTFKTGMLIHTICFAFYFIIVLAATKQLYEWYFLSVCPSVRPSVTPFWLCSHHRVIMKFSGVITKDQGKVHAKGQVQRSKVKVTEVTTQLNRIRTVTPVWIHIWWWNVAYSLMLLRRGALLLFKVIRQISRSYGYKIVKFDPDWAFPDSNSSLNSPMATKYCTKLEVA